MTISANGDSEGILVWPPDSGGLRMLRTTYDLNFLPHTRRVCMARIRIQPGVLGVKLWELPVDKLSAY